MKQNKAGHKIHFDVQIEECAVSMENHHWLNDDLLPGVKVHSGAIARLIQLVQEGYVQIHP
jgi:intracellular sulfur oxidation DsrE/DsrF family protein